MDIIVYCFVIVSVGVIGYAFGNVTGWVSGKEAEAKRQTQRHLYIGNHLDYGSLAPYHRRMYESEKSKQELIDKLVGFSLEVDPQTGNYRKIETVDAEIVCSWCDGSINGNVENLNGYYMHSFCADQSNGRTHKLKLLT